MAAESFPAEVAQQALSFSNGMAWMFNIMVTFCFPVLKDELGQSLTFFMFAAIGYVVAFGVYLLQPETKATEQTAAVEIDEVEG